MIRPIATSLPGMIRDEKMTRVAFAELELVRARGDAAERGARLALPAGGDDQHLAACGRRIASSKPIGGGKSCR